MKYRYIVSDMYARYCGQPPGTRLPAVGALAHMYDVSRSTIHRATEDMERRGWVARRSGRGIYVVDAQGNGVPDDVTPAGAVEKALRERIAELPTGAELPRIVEMAKEYAVSTATVRRSLNHLLADGLLTHRRPRYRVWRT